MYYHGGYKARNIREFDIIHNGDNTADDTGGFYFTDDYAQANSYAIEGFKNNVRNKSQEWDAKRIQRISNTLGTYPKEESILMELANLYKQSRSDEDTLSVELTIINPIIIDCKYQIMDYELKYGLCSFIRKLNYISNKWCNDGYIDQGYEYYYDHPEDFYSKELLKDIEANRYNDYYDYPDPDIIPNCLILNNVNDSISEDMNYAFDVTIIFDSNDIKIITKE